MTKKIETFFNYLSMSLIIILGLFALLLTSFLITIPTQAILINVQNRSLNDVQIGFQTKNLAGSIFEKINDGEFKIYIEGKSNKNGEIVYTYSNKNFGEGISILSNINFPKTNDTWTLKIDLKDKNLANLDSKCFNINFWIDENGKKIEKTEISCN